MGCVQNFDKQNFNKLFVGFIGTLRGKEKTDSHLSKFPHQIVFHAHSHNCDHNWVMHVVDQVCLYASYSHKIKVIRHSLTQLHEIATLNKEKKLIVYVTIITSLINSIHV